MKNPATTTEHQMKNVLGFFPSEDVGDSADITYLKTAKVLSQYLLLGHATEPRG